MGQTDDASDVESGDRETSAPNNRRESSRPRVDAHESDGGNTVFTEPGNADAWIATNTTVDVQR